jgi:hypothetical protein
MACCLKHVGVRIMRALRLGVNAKQQPSAASSVAPANKADIIVIIEKTSEPGIAPPSGYTRFACLPAIPSPLHLILVHRVV